MALVVVGDWVGLRAGAAIGLEYPYGVGHSGVSATVTVAPGALCPSTRFLNQCRSQLRERFACPRPKGHSHQLRASRVLARGWRWARRGRTDP